MVVASGNGPLGKYTNFAVLARRGNYISSCLEPHANLFSCIY